MFLLIALLGWSVWAVAVVMEGSDVLWCQGGGWRRWEVWRGAGLALLLLAISCSAAGGSGGSVVAW